MTNVAASGLCLCERICGHPLIVEKQQEKEMGKAGPEL